MQVENYELFEVRPKWVFLKIETSSGAVGWGEPTLARQSSSLQAAVTDMMEQYIIGEDPADIEDHWQKMYRNGFYRGGPVLMSALAGIDQALWDLKGKQFGAPVYELLGGKARDRIRLYQHVHTANGGIKSPQEVGEDAAAQVEAGFTSLKMTITNGLRRVDTPEKVHEAVARLEAVREAVGNGVDVGLDLHGRASKPMAKRLVTALEPYEPMFYEEPVLPEQADSFPEIAARTSIPIAAGERMHSRWDCKQAFENQAVDIIQPDLSHAGGITEVHKIAAMAEAYDVALAPHCPLGPISLAACLQIDACAPNALFQEQVLHRADIADFDVFRYVANDIMFDYDEQGFVDLPSGPGLGIEMDEEAVREHAIEDLRWQSPMWRHEDGSLAEW